MKRSVALIAVIIVIVLIIGFVLMRQKAQAPAPEGEQVATTTSQMNGEPTFAWRFSTAESGDGLAPRTQVDLIANGEVYNAGVYAGTCAEIAEENLLPGERSGVLCWWAGGGDEIGVFVDEDLNYTLLHGFQEEGTAESEGFRGDFKLIAEIK